MMKARKSLDVTDRNILKIISLYEHLGLTELWYELGEDDTVKGRMTEEELLDRLKSLAAEDFVEKIKDAHWALKSNKQGS